jgi:acyl-CoA dehydrogenase
MDFEFSSGQREIREAVSSLCARFGDDYWRQCDERSAYPEEFVRTLSEAGWLAALIPQEYGGAGLTMLDGSIILEEINHSGGNAAAWQRGAEAALFTTHRFRRVAAAGFRRHRA